MASVVTMKVAGLSALGARLAKLGSETAQKHCRSATGAAAQIVKKGAVRKVQSNPSIETGSLRDAIIVKKLPKSQTDLTSEHIVTVRGRGKTNKKTGVKQKDAPHAHFVEFGTVNMPAEPFLRPGYEENKTQALNKMVDVLTRKIIKSEK